MLEDYIKLKESYPKSVIMIKSGNFYECLNDDATIMNSIFDYKIIRLKKYIRVGFPISKINYITGILTNKEINYLTFEDGAIETEKFRHNKYNDYFDDANCENDNVEEDDVLNVALFGMTAKEWRENNPNLAEDGNIRDYTDLLHLVILSNLENINAELIEMGIPQPERLVRLNDMAKKQMELLRKNKSLKNLEYIENKINDKLLIETK